MPKQTKKKITDVKSTVDYSQELPNKAKPEKKRGAKSQYANKVLPYLDEIRRYTRCGVTEGQLCEFYGVGKTQWVEYKKKYPELTDALYNAKNELKADLINTAYKVATGYEYIETTEITYKDKEGVITGTKTTEKHCYAKPDSAMLQFLAINRFPKDFARDPQTTELRKQALELQKNGKLPFDDGEGV